MKRKVMPLEKIEVTDPDSKGKVAAVLAVLAGEKSISDVCRESELKPIQYYKLEGRMIEAMLAAVKMPATRGRRRSALDEATTLSEKTELLRQEHRRLSSLMRVSKKLVKLGAPARKGRGRPRKEATPAEPAEALST